MAREVHRKRASGLPAPAHVIYEPVVADIHDDDLRRLFQRWQANVAAGHGGDAQEMLDYPEVAPLLRNLMLLEVIRLPPANYDYRYRVYGADIAKRHGQDMTGRLTSELPADVSSFFAELYEAAVERNIVVHDLHTPPMRMSVAKWERLILPLGDPVKWLLVVSIPKAPRR